MMRLNPITFIMLFVLFTTITSCSTTTLETKEHYKVVELPDGSLVCLNHDSALEYHKAFDPREVKISGELYFEVAKGETPFTIKAGPGQLTVLGTRFNVKTTMEEIEVEVEEGIVELNAGKEKVKLKRGERGSFSVHDGKITKDKAMYDFRIWLNSLRIEFEKLGKELELNAKKLDKKSGKFVKELRKTFKKIDE